MHIILCLFLILFSRTAISSSRIAVLISVKNPIHTPIFKSKNWSLSKDLRKYFEKKMGETEFEVVFFENANQETLHSELINPKNIALFWISHATSFEGNESGLTFEDMIVDFEGGNVRDIFQKIHPNLKYLSVLGCKAGPILKKIKQDGFFVNNPDLLIYAKDSTISAKKEIKKSIKDFKQKMNDKTHMRSACLQSKGIPLEIKRFLPSRLSSDGVETSVRVMNRGVFSM